MIVLVALLWGVKDGKADSTRSWSLNGLGFDDARTKPVVRFAPGFEPVLPEQSQHVRPNSRNGSDRTQALQLRFEIQAAQQDSCDALCSATTGCPPAWSVVCITTPQCPFGGGGGLGPLGPRATLGRPGTPGRPGRLVRLVLRVRRGARDLSQCYPSAPSR